jgi:hypothetical protein
MNKLATVALALLAAAMVLGTACGGDDDDDAAAEGTATSRPSGTATSGATSVATSAPTQPASTPGPPSTRVFTAAEATAMLDAILLKPADLTGQWTIMSDTTTDNAAAAAANPETAAANERCGRLLGRTLTNQPADITNAFLGGDTLSFFTTATVYANEAGAIDCAAETATRFAEPGAFAESFGELFIDPLAVQVNLVEYPQVGDGSFAATLSGVIEAAGAQIDLTIFIVAWREGAVTTAVGSARSGATPPAEELTPLIDLVQQRILDAQA